LLCSIVTKNWRKLTTLNISRSNWGHMFYFVQQMILFAQHKKRHWLANSLDNQCLCLWVFVIIS
jgi:hypothetical protein